MEKETPRVRKQGTGLSLPALNASQRQISPDGKERRRSSSTDGRRGTESSSRRSSQLKRIETVSGVVAENLLPIGEDNVNEPFRPLKGSDITGGKFEEQLETMEVSESWNRRTMNWEEKKRSDSIPTPLVSPSTAQSFANKHESPIESKSSMATSMTNTFGPDCRTSDENHNLKPDHETVKTSDGGGKTVSDKGKAPEKTRTPSETSSLHNKEHDGFYSQLQPTEIELTLNDESAFHDPFEDRSDLETNETKGASDATLSAGAMEDVSHGSRSKSPRREHKRNPGPPVRTKNPHITQNPSTIIHSPGIMERPSPDSRCKSPESDRMQSPDPQLAENNSIQDQEAEDVDPVAWFNSDAPLTENFRAFFHDTRLPRSFTFGHSSKSGSDTDSLIMSPTRTVRLLCS